MSNFKRARTDPDDDGVLEYGGREAELLRNRTISRQKEKFDERFLSRTLAKPEHYNFGYELHLGRRFKDAEPSTALLMWKRKTFLDFIMAENEFYAWRSESDRFISNVHAGKCTDPHCVAMSLPPSEDEETTGNASCGFSKHGPAGAYEDYRILLQYPSGSELLRSSRALVESGSFLLALVAFPITGGESHEIDTPPGTPLVNADDTDNEHGKDGDEESEEREESEEF